MIGKCDVVEHDTKIFASPQPRSHSPRGFSRLVWSNLLAQSAEQIGLAAAPIVAVFAFGAGAGETGLLQTAQTLPFLIFAIPAGILADRASRRGLMAGAEALRAASPCRDPRAGATGLLTLPLLALLGFMGASGTVAYSVAAPSLVPALVGHAGARQRRTDVSSSPAASPSRQGRRSPARSSGGSARHPAFGVAAALSGYAVILLFGLVEPPRPALPPRHIGRDLEEGAQFLFTHRLLRPVLLTAVFFNTSFLIMQAIYVPYAVEKLGLTPTSVGATLAAYGIGMVSGALVASRLARP